MSFTYTGSGLLELKRCGTIYNFLPRKVVVVPFKEGDTAWVRHEALKGKVRDIRIKKLKIVANPRTGGTPVIVYTDNLNAVFNESDLVTQRDAIGLALVYYQRKLQEARNALNCL